MEIEADRRRLLQKDALESIQKPTSLNELKTVYSSEQGAGYDRVIYCALIPSNRARKALSKPEWDLSHGGGLPGTVIHLRDGDEEVRYYRFGDNTGVEPLVVDREFHGLRESYRELSEEFRLFHDLYEERTTGRFLKFDGSGDEALVATVEQNRVQVRLKEILQFAAVKEMYLSIQFDFIEHSVHTLQELRLANNPGESQDELSCWTLYFGSHSASRAYRSFSRLLGVHLIKPLPKHKSGARGFAEELDKRSLEFIIGVDEHGEEIVHSADPHLLANYFGADPGSPHYLTPVHFRKTVLGKYYQQPTKYQVSDSYLQCAYLWGMAIDTHHDDKVLAWLGDLGRDLPLSEQLHWRSHNIPPEGGVSQTFFRRQILAEFAESTRAEDIFGRLYRELLVASEEVLGWPLLLPLSGDDRHHLETIRIPSTDEQQELDTLILSMAKILVDSINQRKLRKLIPPERLTGVKGSISLLEAVLDVRGVPDRDRHITFLRRLQRLRSSGTAHRKGSTYREIADELGIRRESRKQVFTLLLEQSLELLQFLLSVIRSGNLSS